MGINSVHEVLFLCKNRRPSVVLTKRSVDEIFRQSVASTKWQSTKCLAPLFLYRKQRIVMTDLKINISLDSGKNMRIKPVGPKKYIGIRSRQVSV